MPTRAETAANFERLEAQARLLTEVFNQQGYELVAPAILQPAALMLDVVGEDLRARTYVFSDQDGMELCLRPDLTVPTCRLYLERHAAADVPERYCYNGPAFRYRPVDAPAGNPREFRQAGLEAFGHADATALDAEIVGTTATALRAAGLVSTRLRLGDLGVLSALLDALAMPERWRQRLRQLFWRPDAFMAELQRLTAAPDAAVRRLPAELVAALDPKRPDMAAEIVAAHLSATGRELQGARTLEDITHGVLGVLADAAAPPLPADHARTIAALVAVQAPARSAVSAIGAALGETRRRLDQALGAFDDRLSRISAAGVDLDDARYQGDFGRKFEYYTGFVFEFEEPTLGVANPVAGGGRYDGLLEAVGAPRAVKAVGGSIYTERLLTALDHKAGPAQARGGRA
jgi:ATP phosphoribosyltransferase regulatory subunit